MPGFAPQNTASDGCGWRAGYPMLGAEGHLICEGVVMKQSSKDEAKGAFHEAKGKVKESVGRATNNPNLEAEGQDEKVAGKVQKKVGQVEKVLDE
jgi:uncharacterized protein YjbJ (UPF0337 family)